MKTHCAVKSLIFFSTDQVTATTNTSPTFRFPPFPLAFVEDPEPPVKPTTDIFESTSPEYPVYRRLPQPAADILTQVARSLPEMLPEPETDPNSIFEEESHVDYTSITTSRAPPITSTQSLEILVSNKDYDQALRILDMLLEIRTEIPPSFSYEAAATFALKTIAQTKDEIDVQVQIFRKWFSLIPRADHSRPRTFRQIRDLIMVSPVNSLRLIMEFGLIAAEKGYANSTHFRVTSVVALYGDPDITTKFIDELLQRNRHFLEQTCTPAKADILDRKLHVDIIGIAVRTLARAGRFDHATHLIPDLETSDLHLTPFTYNFLLRKMRQTGETRYLPHINYIARHKSQARYRAYGLKQMPKETLGSAIRCLAGVGQFDLAIGLLPEAEDIGIELVPTLDFLSMRLRSTGDDQYISFIERVSQLRTIAKSIPVALDSDSTSSANTELPATQPITGVEEDSVDPAFEALIKAWCIDEALALIPAYHQTHLRNRPHVYGYLWSKLKASCDPKYDIAMERISQLRNEILESDRQAKKDAAVAAPSQKDAYEARQASRYADEAAESAVASAPYWVQPGSGFALPEKGFKAESLSRMPHPLTIIRFMELYLASGRTRAIPSLRRFALKRPAASSTLLFAEMLFHARNRKPDLVVRTFVNRFYIVGLPRDELLLRLKAMEPPSQAEDIWTAKAPRSSKLFPRPEHTTVVWRALLEVTMTDREVEDLYAKLLKRAPPAPPPAWKTGVSSPAFTPFVRRICAALGVDRGARVLREMMALGIQPTIYHLTELAMAYSRAGDAAKTFVVLNQVESALETWERAAAHVVGADERRRLTQMPHLVPRVDRVFYIAVIRGFLLSNVLPAAREAERRMRARYGYTPGMDQHLDDLYADLAIAERGGELPRRAPLTSVVHNAYYSKRVTMLQNANQPSAPLPTVDTSRPESSSSAGA
ncbi:hypothetical protein B0H10DRAFT_2209904 [Mycena sp. CBHHK59/15]|nr:hypothetical protein B0H10DRAFT_2209904 [Mycena sp. CBHHK59/15]